LIFGANQAQVQTLAKYIRGLREPDVYKQKGLVFANEVLKLKPGKLKQR